MTRLKTALTDRDAQYKVRKTYDIAPLNSINS